MAGVRFHAFEHFIFVVAQVRRCAGSLLRKASAFSAATCPSSLFCKKVADSGLLEKTIREQLSGVAGPPDVLHSCRTNLRAPSSLRRPSSDKPRHRMLHSNGAHALGPRSPGKRRYGMPASVSPPSAPFRRTSGPSAHAAGRPCRVNDP